MKIGTAIFTYNRSSHTEQVIIALKNNYVLPDKLFLFHDGLCHEKDREEWEKVQKLIEDVDWCEKEIIVSEVNNGLANSIISGVNYMIQSCDAIIVLEDDCVPTRNFINYMVQCINYYQKENSVYGISGYAWPIDMRQDTPEDIYFTGRISSWGWATWKDRWQQYERDNNIVHRIRRDREKSIYLETWGSDLDSTLQYTIEGKADSWAVYWALKCIENGGVFVTPYLSLIHNIGHDGTGVNCASSEEFEVQLEEEERKTYVFPSSIQIMEKTEIAFAPFLGSYTAINQNMGINQNKEKVIIYGAGYYFRCNEKNLNEKYNIIAFIDRNKEGYYAGRKILKSYEISNYHYEKIIIMIKDSQECNKVKVMLEKEFKVSPMRIFEKGVLLEENK